MKYVFGIVVVLLIVGSFSSASEYGSGNYGANNYSSSPTQKDTDSSGGGGSSGTRNLQNSCNQHLDCNEGYACVENSCIIAECFSDSQCDYEQGEVCYFNKCTKLFDVKIVEYESQILTGTNFEIAYFLKAVANISGDVEIRFWIEKEGTQVTKGKDTIYIGNYEEKTERSKLYLPTTITSGVYTLFVELTYGGYKAESYRTVEILVDQNTNIATIKDTTPKKPIGPSLLFIPTLIFLVPILAAIFFGIWILLGKLWNKTRKKRFKTEPYVYNKNE